MSLITPNVFIQTPEDITTTLEPPLVTIYFITGNPGLIGYYHSFLSLLSSKLGACVPNTRFQIYGHSLSGFEIDHPEKDAEPRVETDDDSGCYYDVEAQISFLQKRLDGFLKTHHGGGSGGSDGTNKTGKTAQRQKVILMGHSVGAYLAMEILRRHRERQKAAPATAVDFDIIGGVMLFPTVVDIAKSQSGRKLTVCPSSCLYCLWFIESVADIFGRRRFSISSPSLLLSQVSWRGW